MWNFAPCRPHRPRSDLGRLSVESWRFLTFTVLSPCTVSPTPVVLLNSPSPDPPQPVRVVGPTWTPKPDTACCGMQPLSVPKVQAEGLHNYGTICHTRGCPCQGIPKMIRLHLLFELRAWKIPKFPHILIPHNGHSKTQLNACPPASKPRDSVKQNFGSFHALHISLFCV